MAPPRQVWNLKEYNSHCSSDMRTTEGDSFEYSEVSLNAFMCDLSRIRLYCSYIVNLN